MLNNVLVVHVRLAKRKDMMCFWRNEYTAKVFKYFKSLDSSVRNLIGRTNRERRGIAEAAPIYKEPFAVSLNIFYTFIIIYIHK